MIKLLKFTNYLRERDNITCKNHQNNIQSKTVLIKLSHSCRKKFYNALKFYTTVFGKIEVNFSSPTSKKLEEIYPYQF